MTRKCWRVLGRLLLVPVVLLAGCAAGGAYQGAGSAGASTGDVAPVFRNIDPALRHWYEAPYFNPYEMP